MTPLQSLNLSGLAIESSSSTIKNLSNLHCFILSVCSELKYHPNFNAATKELEVIDIHGAHKLESYFGRVKGSRNYKGKNKNFTHLQRLEHLDLSESQIIRLPIFHLKDSTNDYSTMQSLTRLLVKNCTRLKRLPQLKPLTNLQILYVSGATSLVRMLEVRLEEKKWLRILNISETCLPNLADAIADVINLNQLLIRNCSMIKELPNMENLTHLELFNVSGCDKLEKIDGSFGKISYLHEVNIFRNNLDEQPNGILELANLKKLIIRNCTKLKAFPNLEKLIGLKVFDVPGCTELVNIEGSFENMSYLHEVNLSGTKIEKFPELPKQSILCSSKRIVLADSRCFERDDWSQIKECLAMKSEGSRFADILGKPHEKSEKLVYHDDRYKALDPYVPSDIKIVEINKYLDLGTDVIAKAEYDSISENESNIVSSIFDEFQMRSVKSFWLERCKNIYTLFASDEQQEKEKPSSSSLELFGSQIFHC